MIDIIVYYLVAFVVMSIISAVISVIFSSLEQKSRDQEAEALKKKQSDDHQRITEEAEAKRKRIFSE